MKNLISIILIAVVAAACNVTNKNGISKLDEQIITESLNSRFVQFEIVEIKSDSSNMKYIDNKLWAKLVPVAQASRAMTEDVVSMEKYNTECLDRITAISDTMRQSLHRIEMLQFSKEGSEPCYYVKYRVFEGAVKIEKEEIFYISNKKLSVQYTNSEDAIVKHYPYDWSEFFEASKYEELKQNLLKGYQSAVDLLLEL
jgi:hypothetical protein